MGDIINNAEATGRVAKWGIELASFDIVYKPRTAIKTQALADFVADWTEAMEETVLPESEYWVMHFDGSKMLKGSGAGVVLRTPKGDKLSYVLQIHFIATNNIAEYEALLHGLHVANDLGVKRILCYGDSDLVAQQVSGTWDAKSSTMAAYRAKVDEFAKIFMGYEVRMFLELRTRRQTPSPDSGHNTKKCRRTFSWNICTSRPSRAPTCWTSMQKNQ